MASTHSQPPDKLFLRIIGGSVLMHVVVISVALLLLNHTPKRNFLAPVYSVSLVAPKQQKIVKRPIKKSVPVQAKQVKKKRVKTAPVKPKAVKSVKVHDESAARALKKKRVDEQKAKTVSSAIENIKQGIKRREEQRLLKAKIAELGARHKMKESEIQSRLTAIKSGLVFLDEKKKEEQVETSPVPGTSTGESTGIEASLYLSFLKDKVQNEWNYYEVLRDKNLSVIVAIRVNRDGRVVRLKVEKSSGNQRYDDALLRAVKNAAPFAPLPSGIKGAYLETGLRFCPTCKQ